MSDPNSYSPPELKKPNGEPRESLSTNGGGVELQGSREVSHSQSVEVVSSEQAEFNELCNIWDRESQAIGRQPLTEYDGRKAGKAYRDKLREGVSPDELRAGVLGYFYEPPPKGKRTALDAVYEYGEARGWFSDGEGASRAKNWGQENPRPLWRVILDFDRFKEYGFAYLEREAPAILPENPEPSPETQKAEEREAERKETEERARNCEHTNPEGGSRSSNLSRAVCSHEWEPFDEPCPCQGRRENEPGHWKCNKLHLVNAGYTPRVTGERCSRCREERKRYGQEGKRRSA